jgi:hypothetical protein
MRGVELERGQLEDVQVRWPAIQQIERGLAEVATHADANAGALGHAARPLLAGAVTGSFIVELIFAIPGMGPFFVSSIGQREYFLLTGLTLIYGVLLIMANLFVDILYAWLDPRIRYD